MKTKLFPILFLLIILAGITSCKTDSSDQVIGKVEREYEEEYGSNLIIHREKEIYKGLKVLRLSGWRVEEERKYSEINSDEWVVIFCNDKTYQLIKHTAFMPMDTIEKKFQIKCFSNSIKKHFKPSP